jgi:hypothetical protein
MVLPVGATMSSGYYTEQIERVCSVLDNKLEDEPVDPNLVAVFQHNLTTFIKKLDSIHRSIMPLVDVFQKVPSLSNMDCELLPVTQSSVLIGTACSKVSQPAGCPNSSPARNGVNPTTCQQPGRISQSARRPPTPVPRCSIVPHRELKSCT